MPEPLQPGRAATLPVLLLLALSSLAPAPAAAPTSDDEVRLVLAESGLGARPLEDVAVSPDGGLLLVSGERVSVVEVSTGRQIWAQDRLTGPVAWLGGAELFLARRDSRIVLVNLRTSTVTPIAGVPISDLGSREVHAVGAADAPVFAIAQGESVHLVAWPEASKEAVILGSWELGAEVQDLALSPDGATLAAAAGDVHLLSRADSRVLPARDAVSVAFGEQGRTLAVLDARDRLVAWPVEGDVTRRGRLLNGERRKQAWRLIAGRLIQSTPPRRVQVRSGDDGALLVTLDERGSVAALSSDGETLDTVNRGLTGSGARALAVGAHEARVALGGGDEEPTLRVWSPGEAPEAIEAAGLPALNDVEAAGRFVLVMPSRGDPWALDLETGRGIALPTGEAAQIALSGGQHPLAAVATAQGGVRLWELGGEGVERAPIAGVRAVTGMALSPDGAAIAIAERSGISVWSTSDGLARWRHPLRQEKDRFQIGARGASIDLDMRIPGARPILAWSPDQASLAVDLGDAQGTVLLLDARSGEERGRTRVEGMEEGASRGIAFNARGDALLVHHGLEVELRATADLARAPLQKTLLYTNRPVQSPRVLPQASEAGLLLIGPRGVASASWPAPPRPGHQPALERVQTFRGPPHARAATDLALLDDQNTLLSIGADGTLRLWDLQSASALAVVVPVYAGGATAPVSWTTLTPEGAFDPAGGDPSPDVFYVRGAASLRLDELYERHYRADLLARALAREQGLSDGQLGSVLAAVRPTVSLLGIADGTLLPERCNELVVEARGGSSPVARLDVQVEGRITGHAIGALERVHGATLARQRLRVCVPAGSATLTPIATTQDGLATAGEQRQVKVTAAGASSKPPYGTQTSSPSRPTLRVLSAGVSRYRNSEIDLQYAAADAEALAMAFQDARAPGYESMEVVQLTDASATRTGLLDAMAALQRRTNPEDTVVIFLSGHGVIGESGAWYLLAADTTVLNEDRYAKTAISGANLAEILRALPAQKVVMLIDSCHAGAALNPVGGVRMRAVERVETDQALVRLARSAGVFLIGGSSRERLAAEADRFGHGLFTYALLEALGGKAPCSPVTAACLQDWTERRLPDLYREIGQGEQFPAIFRLGDDFPLLAGQPETAAP